MVVWAEDLGLVKRILEDFETQLAIGDKAYRERLPHVSELIYCLTKSYYNRTSPLPHTPQEQMLFLTGQGLEELLLRPSRLSRKGVTDGIYWSADWLDEDGVGELKSTRISAKRPPEDLPSTWLKQILAYLYVTNGREASLAVLHLLGNYSPPFPMLAGWKMTADFEEVNDNWKWLLKRKAIYLKAIEDKEVPKQFTYNEDWECDHCNYAVICQAKQSIENLKSGREASDSGKIIQWPQKEE